MAVIAIRDVPMGSAVATSAHPGEHATAMSAAGWDVVITAALIGMSVWALVGHPTMDVAPGGGRRPVNWTVWEARSMAAGVTVMWLGMA
jgi:hypothetical protein